MAELRYHPLTRDWVMVASHRQNRPQMPRDWCPFCPGSGKVPDDYDVLKYDNDFPALSPDPPIPDAVETALYKTAPAYGKCEVILYSPKHTATLPELLIHHVTKLVELWTERFRELSADEKIKYVFIFENRGAAVGTTMPHPHGQIYAYPFIPKKLALETESCRDYYKENGRCLICDMLSDERTDGRRMVFENEDFSVFIPFFCEYPYGIYIVSRSHKQNLTQFNARERENLAVSIRAAVGTLDNLFGFQFPYMMCMHQNPVNSGDYSADYHFHIEFFPPMRAADKIKYNASSETGAWAHCNPTAPEDKAVELREAYRRYCASQD
ncbi:MAG: galactose-1-phosphate uridylyltransferase [Clostridiaceae bacterium]|nr:galactose-1-phosphate uridylyltransferase [Clostridiaceae bacterium]